MQNFVQKGETLTVLAPLAVTSGQGVKVGNKFGVAKFTAAISAPVEITTVGVFDLAKDVSAFNDGDAVFFDNTNIVATATPNGNQLIGTAQLTNADGTSALGGNTADASVRVRLNGSFGDGIGQIATVNLTAAQLLAMNGAPVAILPAPGAGKAIIVDSVLFEMTTTATAYANGGAVSFVYHGGAVAVHAGAIPATTITAGAGTSNTLLGPAVAANGTVVPANTGVDITNATAAFITGTGTAKVQVKYRVITL